MDDKKRDDVEMGNFEDSQKEPFIHIPKEPKPKISRRGLSTMNITNNPVISVLAYCLASISMTVVNKYCVSGTFWNLSFFLLLVQVSKP